VAERLDLIGPVVEQPQYNLFERKKVRVGWGRFGRHHIWEHLPGSSHSPTHNQTTHTHTLIKSHSRRAWSTPRRLLPCNAPSHTLICRWRQSIGFRIKASNIYICVATVYTCSHENIYVYRPPNYGNLPTRYHR
jgi:hypothetical protein